ncbi:MAG: hypothetical protein CL798_09485 [Chromatiales bacterium]|nr:hypothetical protein [Chromatiales bacterium]
MPVGCLIPDRLHARFAQCKRGFQDQYALQYAAVTGTFDLRQHQGFEGLLCEANESRYACQRGRLGQGGIIASMGMPSKDLLVCRGAAPEAVA